MDQAILTEEERVVVIRFGHDWDPTCMVVDEVLYGIAEKIKNFAVIYLVFRSFMRPFHVSKLGGYYRSTGFYQNVRAVRSMHGHVLFPQ